MKILISHAVYVDHLGGGETDTVDFIKELEATNNEVLLVTNSKQLAGRVKKSEVVPWFKKSILPNSWLKFEKRLSAIYQTFRPDVVVSVTRYDFIALTKICSGKTPNFFRDHSDIRRQFETKPKLGMFAKLNRQMFFRSLSSSSGILTTSEHDAAFIKKTVPSPPEVTVVYSGLDLGSIKTDREDDGVLTIGTISRLAPGKGLESFIEALSKLQNTKLKSLIVGDGEQREKLENLAAEKGASVEFVGYQDDPSAFYKKIDIFVQPSLYEGWSRTVIEAMAHGCAVIVSDIPTHKEQVDAGKYGEIFKANDSDDLAEKIDSLVSNPEKIKQLSEAGPSRARAVSDMKTIVNQKVLPAFKRSLEINS